MTGREERRIWLLQDGEPLPIDDQPRAMRTADQARCLVRAGFDVTWWTSRFNHNLKRPRTIAGTVCDLGPHWRLVLLDGPPYTRNMSWRRMRHYQAVARHFTRRAASSAPPDLIIGSYPSPELCEAGATYARERRIPFVVDIRDPWPDIFPDYLPPGFRWSLAPLLVHYRRKIRAVTRNATAVVAVSRAMLDWALAYAGRPGNDRDRVVHIGFPCPRTERTFVPPSTFTEQRPLVCLFATTCGRSYDGELLVDAARRLEDAGERRVHFVVAGDGDMRATWVARARGLRSVEFTGWLSHADLEARSEHAHVGLVLMKGGIAQFWLGNKLFEYLSASLGVVNNVPGEPAEIVASREIGINVGPGAGALAEALRRLADDPASVARRMRNARAVFGREFDRDAITTRYVHFLEKLMAEAVLHRAGRARSAGRCW